MASRCLIIDARISSHICTSLAFRPGGSTPLVNCQDNILGSSASAASLSRRMVRSVPVAILHKPFCIEPEQRCRHTASMLPEVRRPRYGSPPELVHWFIIRFFQLVFSAEIVFFSHNKSANVVFQPAYQHSRTGHGARGHGEPCRRPAAPVMHECR
jgi:hypothetical protein